LISETIGPYIDEGKVLNVLAMIYLKRVQGQRLVHRDTEGMAESDSETVDPATLI